MPGASTRNRGQSTPSRTNVGFVTCLSNRRINLVLCLSSLAEANVGRMGRASVVSEFGHNNGMEPLLYCVVGGEIPAGGQFQCRGELCLKPAAQCAYRYSKVCDGLAHQLLPDALEVVLLADRGFASRDLMKYI